MLHVNTSRALKFAPKCTRPSFLDQQREVIARSNELG